MSGDMFKKVKERITDEVSSATNKLQNIQIIDQLAAGINQQIVRHDQMPNQSLPMPPLPHPSNQPTSSQNNNNDKKYDNLINIVANDEYHEEEEELNSEISPQHQLFNEKTIKRLTAQKNEGKRRVDKMPRQQQNNCHELHQTVINIEELSSDLEDEAPSADLMDDVEIDLLTDREIPKNDSSNGKISGDDRLTAPASTQIFKARYRNVVRTLRKLNESATNDRAKSKSEIDELTSTLSALRQELEVLKRQSNNQSPMSSVSNDDKARPASGKSGKIKDLEKLIAKCKESLKNKNSQLKILKDQLSNVDKFKDSFAELKDELNEIKNAHETWTVSVAQNKRIMHQEIEDKNNEINKLKSDISELQSQLKESYSKSQQLRSTIQSLESRLVSTSAAHQKERESLVKELTSIKNLAIKQIQKEHELQLERVKLDLEKSIEALKAEILSKDEILISKAQQEQLLEERNRSLSKELDDTKKKLEDNLTIFNELRTIHENCSNSQTNQVQENVDKEQCDEENAKLVSKISELEKQIQESNAKLEQIIVEKSELESQLKQQEEHFARQQSEAIIEAPKECQDCPELKKKASEAADRYEQSLFDLNAQLDLMTTANADQEKALDEMRGEIKLANEGLKSVRIELEESIKKNESLARVIRDNETEMQTQQEHLDKLSALRHDFDNLKKEHSSQAQSLSNLKSELNERNNELNNARNEVERHKTESAELDLKLKTLTRSLDELVKEKENLVRSKESESKTRGEFEKKLVVSILSAMKNLETPNTSPGSDKSYQQIDSSSSNHDDNDDASNQKLPDPIGLVEKLSSLALDRSNSYMTSNQRLQAVLLDNSRLGEELNRLREELNTVSREKTQETLCSIEEAERLRTENQALIHDQKSYDDQISELENEIDALKQQLEAAQAKQSIVTNEVATETTTAKDPANYEELSASYEKEIEELRNMVQKQERQMQMLNESLDAKEIPDSTQFEYLKNIVYQFMLGKEPLVLARVISAVFKFEQSQIEQICKVQEALQAAARPSI